MNLPVSWDSNFCCEYCNNELSPDFKNENCGLHFYESLRCDTCGSKHFVKVNFFASDHYKISRFELEEIVKNRRSL